MKKPQVEVTHRPGCFTVRMGGVPIRRFTHLEPGEARALVTSDPSTEGAAQESRRAAKIEAYGLAKALRRALGLAIEGTEDERRERLADALLPALVLARQLEKLAEQVDRSPERALITPQEEAHALAELQIATGKDWDNPRSDEPMSVIQLDKLPKGPAFEEHKIGAQSARIEKEHEGDAEYQKRKAAGGVLELQALEQGPGPRPGVIVTVRHDS